jgi:hypothetical protein
LKQPKKWHCAFITKLMLAFRTNSQQPLVSLKMWQSTPLLEWKVKYVKAWASSPTKTTYRRSTSGSFRTLALKT